MKTIGQKIAHFVSLLALGMTTVQDKLPVEVPLILTSAVFARLCDADGEELVSWQ